MRSISSTTTTTSPLANKMSSNLISNYQTTTYGNNATSSSSSTIDWESLRKQARQLENEIDSKLVGFSKLSSNFTYQSSLASNKATPPPPVSSSNSSSSSDLLFITLSNEIEEALKKLTVLNQKMSDYLNNENVSFSSSATVHTLQRHRDILRDYSHEYEKTKRNIISFKEREKLLSTTSSSSTRSMNENNLNNRNNNNNNNSNNSTSLFMKEYDHLKNSHSLIDQQIELAEMTKENLQSQKQTLRMIQQKMNTLAHKFPLINNLVQRIKLKKRKDSLILAAVISVCLIIMILYIF